MSHVLSWSWWCHDPSPYVGPLPRLIDPKIKFSNIVQTCRIMDTTLVYGTGNRLEPMQTRTARVSRIRKLHLGGSQRPQTGKSAQNARVLPLHQGGMRALFGVGSVAAMVVVDAIVAASPTPSHSVAHALRRIGDAAGLTTGPYSKQHRATESPRVQPTALPSATAVSQETARPAS